MMVCNRDLLPAAMPRGLCGNTMLRPLLSLLFSDQQAGIGGAGCTWSGRSVKVDSGGGGGTREAPADEPCGTAALPALPLRVLRQAGRIVSSPVR